jgi:hypothetical protein
LDALTSRAASAGVLGCLEVGRSTRRPFASNASSSKWGAGSPEKKSGNGSLDLFRSVTVTSILPPGDVEVAFDVTRTSRRSRMPAGTSPARGIPESHWRSVSSSASKSPPLQGLSLVAESGVPLLGVVVEPPSLSSALREMFGTVPIGVISRGLRCCGGAHPSATTA